jgi:ABC-type sugar transport system substrate-binding protein
MEHAGQPYPAGLADLTTEEARMLREVYDGLVAKVVPDLGAKRLVAAAGYHGCWVLALGTTDTANVAVGSTVSRATRIDRMMSVIGNEPVLWINVKTLVPTGAWSNPNMLLWDQALVAAQAKYPNIKILPTQYNDTTAQKSQSLVSASLSAHPEINGVFATDDVGTIGGGTALRNAHKTGSISLVGFDADPTLVAALNRGDVKALVAQRPDIEGQKAVQFAVDSLEGKTVPQQFLTPHVVVTKANLNSPAAQQAVRWRHCRV